MAGRDRIAAVKRARERQARVEAAVVRVTGAQRRVEQSAGRRQRAIDAADAKLSDLEDQYAREVEALVDTCGSVPYAAEVLGVDEREVRRTLKRARDHQQDRARPREALEHG